MSILYVSLYEFNNSSSISLQCGRIYTESNSYKKAIKNIFLNAYSPHLLSICSYFLHALKRLRYGHQVSWHLQTLLSHLTPWETKHSWSKKNGLFHNTDSCFIITVWTLRSLSLTSLWFMIPLMIFIYHGKFGKIIRLMVIQMQSLWSSLSESHSHKEKSGNLQMWHLLHYYLEEPKAFTVKKVICNKAWSVTSTYV